VIAGTVLFSVIGVVIVLKGLAGSIRTNPRRWLTEEFQQTARSIRAHVGITFAKVS